jgi:hypothetical protein
MHRFRKPETILCSGLFIEYRTHRTFAPSTLREAATTLCHQVIDSDGTFNFGLNFYQIKIGLASWMDGYANGRLPGDRLHALIGTSLFF